MVNEDVEANDSFLESSTLPLKGVIICGTSLDQHLKVICYFLLLYSYVLIRLVEKSRYFGQRTRGRPFTRAESSSHAFVSWRPCIGKIQAHS